MWSQRVLNIKTDLAKSFRKILILGKKPVNFYKKYFFWLLQETESIDVFFYPKNGVQHLISKSGSSVMA